MMPPLDSFHQNNKMLKYTSIPLTNRVIIDTFNGIICQIIKIDQQRHSYKNRIWGAPKGAPQIQKTFKVNSKVVPFKRLSAVY